MGVLFSVECVGEKLFRDTFSELRLQLVVRPYEEKKSVLLLLLKEGALMEL